MLEVAQPDESAPYRANIVLVLCRKKFRPDAGTITRRGCSTRSGMDAAFALPIGLP